MYTNFQCRNVQEMQRSIVKHCTPRSQIMWNVTLNSSYTSSYMINVDQNKKRKQSPRMRRRDCNLPLMSVFHFCSIVPKRSVFICFLSGSVELMTSTQKKMLRYVVIQNVSHFQADRNTPKSTQKSQLHIVVVVSNFISQFNIIF